MYSDVHESLLELESEEDQRKREMRRLSLDYFRVRQRVVRNHCKVSSYCKQIILVLFALRGDVKLAVEYLQRYKKRYHKISCTFEELSTFVENVVIEVPQEEFNTLLEPVSARDVKAFNAAKKFAAEHAAVLWVEHNNEVKGVAPATENVMEKYDLEYVGAVRVASDMEYDKRRDLRLCRHRSFAWRWRQRWAVAVKALREQNNITLQERQRKVLIFRSENDFLERMLTPLFRAAADPKIGGRNIISMGRTIVFIDE